MHKRRPRKIQLIYSMVIGLILSLILIIPAQAQDETPPRDRVPAGQTIEGDMLLVGQNVTLDGTVTGDLFAFGTTVTVNGEIGGSLYTIAESITTNGKIGGSTYQGGLELTFGSKTQVGRNAYLIGLDLVTESGSIIINDLLAAGLQGWFSGDVGRYMRSVVILLNLEGTIGVGVEESEELPGVDETEEGGATKFNSVVTLIRLEKPVQDYLFSNQPILRDEWIKATGSRQSAEQTNPMQDWFLNYFRKLITVLVIGLLTVWLFPVKLKGWSKQVRDAPLSSGLWGIIAIIFTGFVTLVVALLIPALVVILWRLTFWALASIVLSLGYTSLGFAVILFLIATVYISKVIAAFLIGDLILGRVTPNITARSFLALLLGAVIFVALWLIPSIGWIFSLLAALVGLGAMWLVQRESFQATRESETDTGLDDMKISPVEKNLEESGEELSGVESAPEETEVEVIETTKESEEEKKALDSVAEKRIKEVEEDEPNSDN